MIKVNAIYDLTIGIEENSNVKANMNTMRNGNPLKGELFVRRIPMSDVPEDEEGSAKFIHNLYKEKVNNLIYFLISIKTDFIIKKRIKYLMFMQKQAVSNL